LDIKTKKYTKRKTELKFHYSISDQFQNNLAPFVNFQNSRIPEFQNWLLFQKGKFQKGIGAFCLFTGENPPPSFSHLLPKYRIFLLSGKIKEEEPRGSAGSSSLLLSVLLLCTRESIRFGGFSATICDKSELRRRRAPEKFGGI
jgi:hypothetical protein